MPPLTSLTITEAQVTSIEACSCVDPIKVRKGTRAYFTYANVKGRDFRGHLECICSYSSDDKVGDKYTAMYDSLNPKNVILLRDLTVGIIIILAGLALIWINHYKLLKGDKEERLIAERRLQAGE